MPVQPRLFPEPEPSPHRSNAEPRLGEVQGPDQVEQDADAAANNDTMPSASTSRTAPVWLQRVSLLVLVLFCVYLGVLVMILPWWSRIWDHNDYMQARPALYAFLHNGAVRGIISGLGLLDIWIGVSEAVHYRDYRP